MMKMVNRQYLSPFWVFLGVWLWVGGFSPYPLSPLSLSAQETPTQIHSPSKLIHFQNLDLMGILKWEFYFDSGEKTYLFRVSKNKGHFKGPQPQTHPYPYKEQKISERLIKDFSVNLEGQPLTLDKKGESWEVRGNFKDKEKIKVSFSLLGHELGHYQFSPQTQDLVSLSQQKMISSLDMRDFFQHPDPLDPTLEKREMAVVSPNDPGRTQIDLHTHFTGALQTTDLIHLAVKHEIPYPTEFLKEMNIDYNPQDVIVQNNIELVPLKKGSIHRKGEFGQALNVLFRHFHIGVDEIQDFPHMERIYAHREGVIKYADNPSNGVLEEMLWSLANDYQNLGITYVELSFSKMKDPAWLEVATRILPDIEKKTGVKIRFLVSLRRFAEPNGPGGENWSALEQIMKAADNPYIVGVDILGEELNPITDCADILKFLVEYKKTKAPHFQIRVHAGETNVVPENIKNALALGASRIGHGVHGVTDEVLETARKNDVIVEMNLDSNYALNNIQEVETFRASLKKYLDHGVRVTLGTDGHGLYNSSLRAAEVVIEKLNLTQANWEAIGASNRDYVEKMEKVFSKKWQAYQAKAEKSVVANQDNDFLETLKKLPQNIQESFHSLLDLVARTFSPPCLHSMPF